MPEMHSKKISTGGKISAESQGLEVSDPRNLVEPVAIKYAVQGPAADTEEACGALLVPSG